MLDRRGRSIKALEALVFGADTEVPSALDETDREAVHITLRIALESDAAFRLLLRRKDPLSPTKETDYLCDSIRAGTDFFAIVMQAAGILRGVVVPRQRGSLKQMMVRHGEYLRRLARPKLGLSQRMSLLLALIRIELTFFAQFWCLDVGFESL